MLRAAVAFGAFDLARLTPIGVTITRQHRVERSDRDAAAGPGVQA
jgi:hypothetical protein